jgi:zinc D-Ala-D-Ala carboxypeptidase
VNLSEHFTLEELTFSDFAARNGIANTPMPRIQENLVFLAERLEAVRAVLKAPMRITSGFRSETVNSAVGGSLTSQHRYGLAADFVAPAFGSPYEVAKALEASNLQYDQLIHEFGSWVHISFVRREPRRQALSIFKRGPYLPGILPRAQ